MVFGQLAFSDRFATLENEPDSYTTTGFLGQTRDFWGFDEPCAGLFPTPTKSCVTIWTPQTHLQNDDDDRHRRAGLVQSRRCDCVSPFNMSKELSEHKLSDPRQEWAEDKADFCAAL